MGSKPYGPTLSKHLSHLLHTMFVGNPTNHEVTYTIGDDATLICGSLVQTVRHGPMMPSRRSPSWNFTA